MTTSTRRAANDFVVIRPHDGAPGFLVHRTDGEGFVRDVIDRVIALASDDYAPDAAEQMLARWRAWHDEREVSHGE